MAPPLSGGSSEHIKPAPRVNQYPTFSLRADVLRLLYPAYTNHELAHMTGMKPTSVKKRGLNAGLRKRPEVTTRALRDAQMPLKRRLELYRERGIKPLNLGMRSAAVEHGADSLAYRRWGPPQPSRWGLFR